MTEFVFDTTPPADDAPQKEKELYKLEKLCIVNLAKFKYLYKDFLKSRKECEAELRDDFFDQLKIDNRKNFIKDLNRQFIKNLLFSFVFFMVLSPIIFTFINMLFESYFLNIGGLYLINVAISTLAAMLITKKSLKKEQVYASGDKTFKEVVSLRKNIFIPFLYILISYLCLLMLSYYYHRDISSGFNNTISAILNIFFNNFFFILLQAYICYRPLGKLKNEAKQEIEKYKRYLARDDELKKKSEQLLQQLVQFFPNLKKECDLSPELFDYYFDCDLSSVSAGPASDEMIELYDKAFDIRVSMILDRFKPAIYLLEDGKVATAEEALLTAYQQRDLNKDDE